MEAGILTFRRHQNYTVITNHVFSDQSLSMKAKGLYCQLASLPDGYDFSIANLAELFRDGVHAISTAIAELKAHGYLRCIREREADGTYGKNVYILYEIPEPKTPEETTEKRSSKAASTANINDDTHVCTTVNLNEEDNTRFEMLCRMSLKPVRKKEEAKKAFRSCLNAGYTADQILQAYQKYVIAYKADNNATTKYAKQLHAWLMMSDGLGFYAEKPEVEQDKSQNTITVGYAPSEGIWLGRINGGNYEIIEGSEHIDEHDVCRARKLFRLQINGGK